MSTRPSDVTPPIQLIVGSMLAGVVIFAIVVGVLNGPPPGPITPISQWPSDMKLLSAICLIQMIVVIPAGFLLRNSTLKRGRDTRSGEVPQGVKLTAILIQTALYESFGLFGLVICIVSKTWVPGGAFALVSIALLTWVLLDSMRSERVKRDPYAPTEKWSG